MSAIRGRCPLMLRTGWSVVRRTTRVSPSASSIASVVSDTCTVTVCSAMARPRATFWPATMITPVFEARRCTRIGSVEGRGTGPTRPAALQPDGLIVGERVRPGAQQLAGLGVEEQQRAAFLDIDPDPATGEDLRGQHDLVPSDMVPFVGDGPLDLDHRPAGAAARTAVGCQRRRAGLHRALGASRARSLTVNRERSDLIRSPPIDRCTHSQSTQNRTDLTGPRRAQPELVPAQAHVPRRRHHLVQLDRRTRPRHPPAHRLRVRLDRPSIAGAGGAGGATSSAGGSHSSQPAGVGWCEPVGRHHRHLLVQGLVRPVGVVFADPRIDRCLRRLDRPERSATSRISGRKVPWKRSTFPFWFGDAGSVSRWVIPLWRQILSNNTSPAPLRPNRSVNCLPLSVITSSGTPNRASACGERQTHRPAGRPLHHRGHHTEPGMVIDPGHDLRLPQLPGHRVDQLRSRRRCRCPTAASAPAARTG